MGGSGIRYYTYSTARPPELNCRVGRRGRESCSSLERRHGKECSASVYQDPKTDIDYTEVCNKFTDDWDPGQATGFDWYNSRRVRTPKDRCKLWLVEEWGAGGRQVNCRDAQHWTFEITVTLSNGHESWHHSKETGRKRRSLLQESQNSGGCMHTCCMKWGPGLKPQDGPKKCDICHGCLWKDECRDSRDHPEAVAEKCAYRGGVWCEELAEEEYIVTNDYLGSERQGLSYR